VLRELFISMRPRQWSKNIFVFAGLVFSGELFNDPLALAEALLAFAVFCMASSAVYLINDLVDVERDRLHPTKRNRPLAARRLDPRVALIAAIILIAVAAPVAFLMNAYFGGVVLVYFVLMLAYSFVLKNIVIVDVFAIAAGFVLRAAGGAVAIQVSISPWLLVCMTLLALFLGLAKRRHELLLMERGANVTRTILKEYSARLVEEMISIVTASTIMAYSLYTFFGADWETMPYRFTRRIPFMMATIPFVLYGVFRYLYLVYRKNSGGSPEEILLGDLPFLVNMVLWGISVVVILYFV
jgi:4-hydroxybenzoate polyprenyltransferase